MSRACRLLAIPLFCSAGFAQHESQTGSIASDSGTALFRRHCRSCHGRNGEGGRAPSLTGRLHAGDTDDDMARVISDGIAGSEMTAYSSKLGDRNITRIVAYLRSVRRDEPPMSGDSMRGETLFWGKGGCGNCHAVGRRGNRLGPDLSRIGRQRSLGFLRESLLEPDADVAADYTGVTVVTRDGKRITGIERALDEFCVVVQDFSGKVHSFDRQNLNSVDRQGSLMPDYKNTFTPGELSDVLKYLSTLGTHEVAR